MANFGVVAIIGPGLLGGSVGLALRQRGLADAVIGVARSEDSARRAAEAGVVDRATTDLAGAVSGAQLIVAASPVRAIPDACKQAAAAAGSGAVFTDCGSTKDRLVAAVESALGDRRGRFVGSHPLAGDHKSGPESARADLLAGRVVVVTPTDHCDADAVRTVTQLWSELGATVRQMTPAEHDAALARTSHAPHVIASALAAATPAEILGLTGGGWRDTTRVAAGAAGLWRDILLDNPGPTLAALDAFGQRLEQLKQAIADADADAIYEQLEEGKLRRDALGS